MYMYAHDVDPVVARNMTILEAGVNMLAPSAAVGWWKRCVGVMA